MPKDSTSVGAVNWDFTTFLRYFVPGLFTAFWVSIYAIRMTDGMGSGAIVSVRALFSYLFNNWPNMTGLILTLGGFLGLLFVGTDPIIRAFMGCRMMNFVFKYLLSSKQVDFAYFQFMRLHDISHRYERLPRMLLESSLKDSSSFKELYDGDYSSRYFLRETIQNYFWDQCIKGSIKSSLARRYEQASTYLYLSFVSLTLLVVQSCFYAVHLWVSVGSFSSVTVWITDYYYIPMVLFGYILLTFAYNLYYYKVPNRNTIREVYAKLKNLDRAVLMVASGLTVVALMYIVVSKFKELSWIPSLDAILFVVFFLLFVSFYWSSVFQFSRYAITFEHCFEEYREDLLKFANTNLKLIKTMDTKLSRKKPDEGGRPKRGVLLKSLAFLFLLLASMVTPLVYLQISSPVKNETITVAYSETSIRVLNLTSGNCAFIWLTITPSVSEGRNTAECNIKLHVTDPTNQTVLDLGSIATTNLLFPISFVAQQNGLYDIQFSNSVGSQIDKTIWFSYRVGQSILGIPIEYWLLYDSITCLALILGLMIVIFLRGKIVIHVR